MADTPDDKPAAPTTGGDPTGAAKAVTNSGRFTPKAAKPVNAGGSGSTTKKVVDDRPAYARSGRFTAPTQPSEAEVEAYRPTRPWVPYLMFLLLIAGGILIVLNYVGILPSSPSQWYLLGGIVAITLGFVTATQLR